MTINWLPAPGPWGWKLKGYRNVRQRFTGGEEGIDLLEKSVYVSVPVRRGGRAVECTGLENRHGFVAHPGFESLPLRHFITLKQSDSYELT